MSDDNNQRLLLLIEELEERVERLEIELKKFKDLKENTTEKQSKKMMLKD